MKKGYNISGASEPPSGPSNSLLRLSGPKSPLRSYCVHYGPWRRHRPCSGGSGIGGSVRPPPRPDALAACQCLRGNRRCTRRLPEAVRAAAGGSSSSSS